MTSNTIYGSTIAAMLLEGAFSAPSTTFVANNQDVFHASRFGADPAFIIYKRSAESIPVDFDLSGVLPLGVTVSSVVSIACDQSAGPICGTGVISTVPTSYQDSNTTVLADLVVQFFAAGGTPLLPPAASLAPYIVRMIYRSSDGATREAIGYIAVVDLPLVGVELS